MVRAYVRAEGHLGPSDKDAFQLVRVLARRWANKLATEESLKRLTCLWADEDSL